MDGLVGDVKLADECLDQVGCFLVYLAILLVQVLASLTLLYFANVEDVVDRIDDLPNLLRVLVLFVDLVLKVLLQDRILGRYDF